MSFKVHFRELAFQRVDPENRLVPIGDPVIFKKGEDVPDWASPATVSALVQSGMVLPVADPIPEVETSMGGGIANPEVPMQFGGPVTLESLTATDVDVATGQAGLFTEMPDDVPTDERTADPDPAPVVRPKDSDTKPMWEAYAESIGIPRGEAESLSKTALRERVAGREAEMGPGPVDPAGQQA
jgi:hypothetical protein